MKFGSLGPRGTKLYIRNVVIFLAAFLLWWVSPTLLKEIGIEENLFWLSLAFWLIMVLVILSQYNIGYLGKELSKAIAEDNKEQKENMRSKQPWEE